MIKASHLRTENLAKVFGKTRAVNAFSIEVKEGEVFGLLGPNGAGKTTTIEMILGLLRPTCGSIEIMGRAAPYGDPEGRRHIGAMIDGVAFYRHLSGIDNLMAFGGGLARSKGGKTQEILELVGLAGKAAMPVATYSHGMRRRLALAIALAKDPEIFVLDEPAEGLDPQGISELRGLIKALARDGRSILLSSHLLHEVQLTCDRVAILKRGEIIAQGRVESLISRAPWVELKVEHGAKALEMIRRLPGVASAKERSNTIAVECHRAARPEDVARDINRTLASSGIFAWDIRPGRAELEDVFFDALEEVR